MGFNDDLNAVLKYGRLRTQQEWAPHIDDMAHGTKAIAHSDTEGERHQRLILADKFADEGDPREHILRQQETSDDAWGMTDERGRNVETETELSDGSRLRAVVTTELPRGTTPHKVCLIWGGWTPTRNYRNFGCNLSADEAKSMLSQFSPEDAPDIDKLHQLIDRHFPKAETKQ